MGGPALEASGIDGPLCGINDQLKFASKFLQNTSYQEHWSNAGIRRNYHR